jgi:hypothetical protein
MEPTLINSAFLLRKPQAFTDDRVMNGRINQGAVWVLVVIHQVLAFGWYKIFGNAWLNYHARTMTDIENTHDVKAYVLGIVAAIAANYALAWVVGKLQANNGAAGLRIALLCWFAFAFLPHATISVFSAFETNPWPLVLIDMGWLFVAFAVSGFVLGSWQRKGPAAA